MTNRFLRRLGMTPILVLTVAFATACADEATDVEDPLVGDFAAEEAVFTDNADAENTFDVIDSGGTLDMDFREDGTFESNLAIPDRDPLVRSGTFSVDGDQLLITENGTTRAAAFERSGGNLIVDDPGTTFDFGDGVQASATMNARFQQR